MDDVRKNLARDVPLALRDGAGELDDLIGTYHRLVRTAVTFLETLGIRLSDADSLNEIAGDVAAAVIHRREMADFPLVKNRDVGCPGPHLDERNSKLLLVFGENGKRARKRLEHELFH